MNWILQNNQKEEGRNKMAIVSLDDVSVSHVNSSGFGVKVVEQSAGKDNRIFKQRFSVWFREPHGLVVGDRISLSGFISAKVGDPWTDRDGVERTSVELSINSPRMKKLSNSPESFDDALLVGGSNLFGSSDTPF